VILTKVAKNSERIMKTFRMRKNTYDLLLKLSERVNEKTTLHLSTTAVLELIILKASKEKIEKILEGIKES
jgi:metal-responsive CopG/Arc/MetJ family transcriptional regulator